MLRGHGDDAYRYGDRIRSNFSSNVWYGADLSGLWRHLSGALERLSSYPEPDAVSLAERLAGHWEIDTGSVCVTNGATEAFYLIAQAWGGRHSVIVTPSFSEYEDACTLHGHRMTFVSLDELLDGTVSLAGEGLVWLCNPNNPDGRTVAPERLCRLIEAHPERVFVVDHSYAAFTRRPLLSVQQACGFENVVLVHSMTKQYAVAGLRLGYLTAHPALIRRIAMHRMPWSVNALAVEAGLYLLAHAGDFELPLEEYLQEAERFRQAVGAIPGVETLPSDCHFFTGVLARGRSADLKEYLAREEGILIRDASNFRRYGEGHFRLAAQRPAENDRCVQAIARWMSRF